jgi:hypothetical protein
MNDEPLWCAACGLAKPADALIAFWPVDRPEARRYVCRPTLNEAGRYGLPCFREAVKARSEHVIGLVAA